VNYQNHPHLPVSGSSTIVQVAGMCMAKDSASPHRVVPGDQTRTSAPFLSQVPLHPLRHSQADNLCILPEGLDVLQLNYINPVV
jgi:hypothetical protein